jgi:flavin reductase (DIM6/NTAB) family NADH-FMN oxidoreductase RutF
LKFNRSTVNPDTMREAMRQWATGVTVVSSRYEGMQHGMTVSSFTSISLDPPLVLVSLAKDTRTHELVQQSNVFGVTLLNQTQNEISDRFAGRNNENLDRFAGIDTFTLHTGAPFLGGGLSYLDCNVILSHDLGDHTLFIGEVVALKVTQDGSPLIYYDRGYRRLMRDDAA